MRNSDTYKKKIPRLESDEQLEEVAQRGGGLFVTGDVQDLTRQALDNLL